MDYIKKAIRKPLKTTAVVLVVSLITLLLLSLLNFYMLRSFCDFSASGLEQVCYGLSIKGIVQTFISDVQLISRIIFELLSLFFIAQLLYRLARLITAK